MRSVKTSAQHLALLIQKPQLPPPFWLRALLSRRWCRRARGAGGPGRRGPRYRQALVQAGLGSLALPDSHPGQQLPGTCVVCLQRLSWDRALWGGVHCPPARLRPRGCGGRGCAGLVGAHGPRA